MIDILMKYPNKQNGHTVLGSNRAINPCVLWVASGVPSCWLYLGRRAFSFNKCIHGPHCDYSEMLPTSMDVNSLYFNK